MDLADIIVKMSAVEQVLLRLEHRLFGNGSPGELSELKTRASNLEEFKNKVLGALTVIALLLGIVGAALFNLILKRH